MEDYMDILQKIQHNNNRVPNDMLMQTRHFGSVNRKPVDTPELLEYKRKILLHVTKIYESS